VDNKTADAGTILLYDVAGRLVVQYPFAAGTVTTLPTSISRGSYVAKAITKTEKTTKQLILH